MKATRSRESNETGNPPVLLSDCLATLPRNSLALICDRDDNVRAVSGNVDPDELPAGARALAIECSSRARRHTPRRSFADAAALLRLSQDCLKAGVRLFHLVTEAESDADGDTVTLSCREDYAHLPCSYAFDDETGRFQVYFLDGTTDVVCCGDEA